MKLKVLRVCAALAFLGLTHSAMVSGQAGDPPLFFIPQSNSVQEILSAINGAKSTFHMAMYRLTDREVTDALIAAHQRGVDVQVIVDAKGVAKEKPDGCLHSLQNAGIKAVKSTSGFRLSHYKSFTVDHKMAYIMTINLTSISNRTRGVGYPTADPTVIDFFETLFALDMNNANNGTADEPNSIPEQIVLSPVNSRDRLAGLIGLAKQSIKMTVENFSDPKLEDALASAVQRGVKVEVIMPRCDLTSADFDMKAAGQLAAAGVEVRMMPAPMSADLPYMHQKAMVVDGQRLFIGSENFTFSSLDYARELGIIVNDMTRAAQFAHVFDGDFAKSMEYSEAQDYRCPSHPFDDDLEQ